MMSAADHGNALSDQHPVHHNFDLKTTVFLLTLAPVVCSYSVVKNSDVLLYVSPFM
jgi:hypothetical protein